MSTSEPDSGEEMNWNEIVDQIHELVGTNIAIIDRFGMILASKMPEYKPQSIVPPVIWDFVQERKTTAEQLGVENIHSIVLEVDNVFLVFTGGNFIHLMAELEKTADLTQYMRSVDRIIKTLDKSKENPLVVNFAECNLDPHFELLRNHVKENINQNRYPIFKQIVKYMRKTK